MTTTIHRTSTDRMRTDRVRTDRTTGATGTDRAARAAHTLRAAGTLRAERTANPGVRTVVFRDQSAGIRYLTRSDLPTPHSTTWPDGRIYPVVEMDLSSEAHLADRRRAA